jgi:hypothetical protein
MLGVHRASMRDDGGINYSGGWANVATRPRMGTVVILLSVTLPGTNNLDDSDENSRIPGLTILL